MTTISAAAKAPTWVPPKSAGMKISMAANNITIASSIHWSSRSFISILFLPITEDYPIVVRVFVEGKK